ncbi:MAG: type II secretion system F family protein [Alphaproteobacteria bacterium]
MMTWLNEGGGDMLIAVLAALAAIGVVLSTWFAFIERNPMTARVKTLTQRRDVLRAEFLGEASVKRNDKDRGNGLLKRFAVWLNLHRKQEPTGDKIKNFLAQAGIRSRDAMAVYLFVRMCAPVVLGTLAGFYVSFSKYASLPLGSKILIIAIAAGIGYLAPAIYVRNVATKRKKRLRNQLPDALDLLVICAEAGLSLDSAVNRVVREMQQSSPEIAEELGLFSIELNFLPDRALAFQNLTARTDMDEVRAMVNTLTQAERYGTPLAQALRILSAEFRNDRMTRAEEKAARLPAIMTVPMMIFILPCLFIVILGPAILRTIDALSRL